MSGGPLRPVSRRRGWPVHHPKGILSSVSRLLSSEPSNPHLDVLLVCRDGTFRWSRLLLAANSPLLLEAFSDQDSDEGAPLILLLPDVSVSTLSTMLRCTVNPAVKNDTLSVNELEVMKLLAFGMLRCEDHGSVSGNLGESSASQGSETSRDRTCTSVVIGAASKISHDDPLFADSDHVPCEEDFSPLDVLKSGRSHHRSLIDGEECNGDARLDLTSNTDHRQEPNDLFQPPDQTLESSCLEPEQHASVAAVVSDQQRSAATRKRSSAAKEWSCPDPSCGLTFQRRLHMERHSASHDPSNRFACDQCGKVFRHPDHLKLHERYHRDAKTETRCDDCDVVVKGGSRALRSHKERFHEPTVRCRVCRKDFSCLRTLKRHRAKAHPESDDDDEDDGRVYCRACGRGFGSAQALAVHKRTHDDAPTSTKAEDPKYARCASCGKLFASRHHLRMHERRTHEASTKVCIKCGRKVKDLSRHDRICHSGQGAPRSRPSSSCADCGTTFSSVYVLRLHRRRAHSLQGPVFKCEVCSKYFATKSALGRHGREVHGENSHECDECGLFFPVRHSLERHVRHVHHPVTLECPYCDATVVHLAAHLTGSSHGLSAEGAKHVVEGVSGKVSARTDITLNEVRQRKKSDEELKKVLNVDLCDVK